MDNCEKVIEQRFSTWLIKDTRSSRLTVEYVLFADEGHGFRKKVNRITASNAYVEFLKKHL